MNKKTKSKGPLEDFQGEGEIPCSNVHWKEVLDEIYNRVPNAFGPGKFKHEDRNPIAKKLNITDQELYRNVIYLTENDLIEIRNEGQWTSMYPTGKGFDAALQNEKIKVDLKRQLGIMSLTAVIALTAIFSFLFSTGKYDSYIQINAIVAMYIFGLFLIFIISNLKGIILNLKRKL
jgi:hypothetical protein